MADDKTPRTRGPVEQAHANLLASRLRKAAERLRDLADSAEREAKHIHDVGTRPVNATYSRVAATVQHDILWGLANLHLDALTDDAQQADEYRLKGE